MRQTWRRFRVRGDFLYFMALEDLEGMLEVAIAGETYRRHKNVFNSAGGSYVIEGLVELDAASGEPFIRAEKIAAV